MPLAHAETHAVVENPIARVLAEGRVAGLANHTLLWRRDGSPVPIDDSAAPIRTADGEIIGAVMVFRDVTERYATEAKLAQAEVIIDVQKKLATLLGITLPDPPSTAQE